jgi:hypothetical protein
MKTAIILFRKTAMYPDPVLCELWLCDGVSSSQLEKISKEIEEWKADFCLKFPEFKKATWIISNKQCKEVF